MSADQHLPGERPLSRRDLLGMLARAGAAALALPFLPRAARAEGRPAVTHPEPRPGITAEHVLADEDVPRKYRDAYAAAREIPEVLDGLFCHCDCAAHRGLRSLLGCFESKMPQSCGICLGEARLARTMHREGKSLADIRAAVDRRFGRDEHDGHDGGHR